ncbi:MAG: MBL fold metallo-hydrolase [Bacteroidales bacterium]|nr:MBL fold metallo-hydrolase [Bacteroidales bacterium]
MFLQKFEFNMFPVNSYLVWDETLEAAIIDAGMYFPHDFTSLASFVDGHKLRLTHLLCTHLHFDHTFGNAFMLKEYGLKAEAHEADLVWLTKVNQEQCETWGLPFHGTWPMPGQWLHDGDTVSFGHTALKVMHVPGHSEGGLAFYNEADRCVFTGDTLFQGSIGRTDLHGGSYQQIVQSLHKLLTLPDDTKVYPGHGEATTIGMEKKYNPCCGNA